MVENPLKAVCLAIVLLPLLVASLIGVLNRGISRAFAHRLAITAVGLAFLLSCTVLSMVVQGTKSVNVPLYTWGVSGGVHFQVGFLIDRLSALMMVVVSFVSWMVHIYTTGYMIDDPGYRRFFSYISLFTFGMLMLVMANNFLQLFFGWEMVGLVSYLLIGFWFQKESANLAGLKAFLVNRLGDLGFLMGIAAVLYYFNSLDYQTVFASVDQFAAQSRNISLSAHWDISAITFICMALFMGAMGKSAQIPLHVWLPDSMEGPTPISALIHAATMVTAGIFMVARMSPLFEYSEATLNIILGIGSLTCFLMGLLGIIQEDIKRVIAYSTLSQLGIMMTAMGASAYALGIFHLMTHAFFKALLFLGAGSVIIALHHEQNIWKMGGLRKYLPVTYWTMWVGSLALIGFPFFSGFYSKDLILEALHLSTLPAAEWAYPLVLGSLFITALYTFRLFFVVFHGEERIEPKLKSHLHEPTWVITLPLVGLVIPSIISGYGFVGWMFEGFFAETIRVHPNHSSFARLASEFSSPFKMGLRGLQGWPFWLSIIGLGVAWYGYLQNPKLPGVIQRKLSLLYRVLKEKYGFDLFYRWVIAAGARGFGFILWKVGDQWVIDGLIVNGSANSVGQLARYFRRLQTGYLYHYAFAMMIGFLCLMMWLVL